MRRSSKILIGLAGLLVVLAALTRFVVLPMGSKLPANTKASAQYTGTATLLNAGPTADARDDCDPTGERGWGAGHARIVARQQRPS